MQDNQIDVIKRLYELIAINSQSSLGNGEIINLLISWFSHYECTVEEWVRESDNVRGKNLLVKIPGERNDHELVFVCHMDTVPISTAWDTDPFALEEIEGNLYGLGTCDTKGGVAALIEAILTLKHKPTFDTYILFDGDEEEYTTGAKKFLKSLNFKNPSFIFIEPTDKQILIAQRGVMSATIVTHGISQHASLATTNVNQEQSAIYKMVNVMEKLIEDINEISREQDFLLGTNTQNFGLIAGGTGGNVIPDTCLLSIDRRLLPTRDPQKEKERILNLLKQIDNTAEMKDAFTAPSFLTNKNSLLVSNISTIVRKQFSRADTATFSAWSEAGLFADKGDVIILGPGSLKGQAHKANEYVNAQELFHFVHIFQNIMMEIQL